MPPRKKKGKGKKAKSKPPTGGGAANNDGGNQPQSAAVASVVCIAAAARLKQEQTMSQLLSNLTLRTEETKCCHGAGPALARCHPSVENFITEFDPKLKQVVNKFWYNWIRDKTIKFDAPEILVEIMDLVPRNLHPDYRDRDACDVLVACLVSLGTDYLLHTETDPKRQQAAGLLAQSRAGTVVATVLFVGAVSRGLSRGFSRGLDPGVVNRANCKMNDLWQDSERELTKFFHKRNGCICLMEKYERLRTQKRN